MGRSPLPVSTTVMVRSLVHGSHLTRTTSQSFEHSIVGIMVSCKNIRGWILEYWTEHIIARELLQKSECASHPATYAWNVALTAFKVHHFNGHAGKSTLCLSVSEISGKYDKSCDDNDGTRASDRESYANTHKNDSRDTQSARSTLTILSHPASIPDQLLSLLHSWRALYRTVNMVCACTYLIRVTHI